MTNKESKQLNIVLFGGGRWARVIAGVLCNILPEHYTILWVTQHNYDALVDWLKKQNHDRITLLKNDKSLWEHDIQACIVATAPTTHAFYAQQSIARGVPTFVEKPFVLRTDDGERLLALAKETNCPAGVNLVFMYASYLQDFAACLSGQPLNNIELIWHDPALEVRYGEEKRPDFYTCTAHDMFPHAWSILKILIPGLDFQLGEVTYSPDGTIIVHGTHGSTALKLSFSRRAKGRVRQIKVNDGETCLDFTQEPGFIIQNATKTENIWKGKTPLYQSLEAFLKAAQDPQHILLEKEWPTSLENCMASVRLADQVHAALQAAQYQYLRTLGAKEEYLLNNHTDMLIDLFLPQIASRGERPPVKTAAEKKDFAAYALSLYDQEQYDRKK